ncbi:MAG: DUF933 domain-containing protein [Elusimicrobia bacterium]|nr:DUF933 domain-containing protein [Elusimicrobiota bacterium]
MLISINDLDYEEGKVKYEDVKLEQLLERTPSKKIVPFYFEIIRGSLIDADILASSKENILDLLIPDIEKAETRIKNTEEELEKVLMEKVISVLEEETPLSEKEWTEAERDKLRALGMLTMKPVVKVDKDTPIQEFLKRAIEVAKIIFFYTAGPREIHAWDMKQGATAVECAGKIHSDFEKGFVRADVVAFEDYLECHSMNDAKSKGLAKLVEKDFVISDGDIVEIRSGI